jgi:iron complex outermembrane receptor protein
VRCAHSSEDCSLELSTSVLTARSIVRDPAGELWGTSGAMQDNQGRRLVQHAAITTHLGGFGMLRAGVQQSFETLQSDLSEGDERRAKREATLPTLNSDTPLIDALHIYTLAGFECHSTSASVVEFGRRSTSRPEACAVHEPVGRLGVSLEPGLGLQFLGNVGRYVRVPTLGELYGSSALVEGNRSLNPEQGISSDVGVRVSEALSASGRTRLGADAFVFSRSANQMIRYQRVSSGSLAPFNVASARIQGAELAFAFDWTGNLRAETAITALDPRDTTASTKLAGRNDILPFTSRLVTSSRVEIYLKIINSAVERPTLGVSHFYRASRFQDPAGLDVLPAQNFFDVDASCSMYEGRLTVRAAVKNLGDARAVDLLGLPLPGRTAHFSLEMWL